MMANSILLASMSDGQLAILHFQNSIRHLPHLGLVADKDHLVEAAECHGMSEHADVFLCIFAVQLTQTHLPKPLASALSRRRISSRIPSFSLDRCIFL